MLFASREVRWEKVCPTELLIKYGGRGPNSRPKAQFQLIRTDRGQQITFFLCGIALNAIFCVFKIWLKAVRVRLTFPVGQKKRNCLQNLFDSVRWMFQLYVVLRCNMQKAWKLPKLEILERSVLRVRIGKSRPLDCTRLTNQIQGFWIPGRWLRSWRKIKQSSVLSNFLFPL